MPEEKDRLLLVCAEVYKAGEKVFIVTDWEVERVGSRAEVIPDGRPQCTRASEDMVRIADYCFKKGGVSHYSNCYFPFSFHQLQKIIIIIINKLYTNYQPTWVL